MHELLSEPVEVKYLIKAFNISMNKKRGKMYKNIKIDFNNVLKLYICASNLKRFENNLEARRYVSLKNHENGNNNQ